jgi:integrase
VTPEELPRLFDAIDAAEDVRIADYLRLALLTGARKTSILRMRFADVDLARAVWTIPASDSKNGSPVHVPLVAEAVEVIRSRLVAAGGREYVFPGRHGKGPLIDVRKPIAAVFKAAGFQDVRLHDLRRTFGSWQAANGSSELLIGRSLGHRNTRSTAVYARLTLDPVRQSVERATDAMRAVVQADRAKRESKKGKGRS